MAGVHNNANNAVVPWREVDNRIIPRRIFVLKLAENLKISGTNRSIKPTNYPKLSEQNGVCRNVF